MAEEGAEPEEAGVTHINQFGKEQFGGVLHCSWFPNKGRVLHATRSYKPGEVILSESPLHIVQEQEKSAAFKKLKKLCTDQVDNFDYEPLWYWCAMQSLTKEQLKGAKAEGLKGTTPETQHNLLLLHHEEVTEPSSAADIIARELTPSADPITIERLIQIWVLNCFEYSDSPQGYSTYFYSSFMSHSCFPNAVWHYTEADHVLRSRREINVGDEVCISYLPESGLLQSAPARRMELNETKRFWCDCERCRPDEEDRGRGLRCPKCGEGQIFARTPLAGPAKDGSLLASHFVGVVCPGCKHAVTSKEAGNLAALEKKLQDIVDKYTKLDSAPVKQLQGDEAFIDQNFQQHVLADLAWEQFGSHYAAKRRMADQMRLLQLRCNFHKAAYPGLSGAHAWALEALGDCMRTSSRDNKKKDAAPTEAEALASAKESYAEALGILRLMFGEDHEYVTDVVAKETNLSS